MRLKDLRFKFQGVRLRSLLLKGNDNNNGVNIQKSKNVKKPSWMMPISHGYHIVDGGRWGGEDVGGLEAVMVEQLVPDNVVVQREEMGNLELWYYGVSDATIANDIATHLHSNFFSKMQKESMVSRKSKETMRKAYLNAKATHEKCKADKKGNVGSASVMIINGEKIVMAQMGGYKAIVCKDGIAHQTHHYTGTRHWPHHLISGPKAWRYGAFLIPSSFMDVQLSGALRIPKEHIQACHKGCESSRKQTNSSELTSATDRIDSETEFVILASIGISEVMRNQEAVDLIRHIDNPQEAAECLAREALTRISRRHISCLVIRFD